MFYWQKNSNTSRWTDKPVNGLYSWKKLKMRFGWHDVALYRLGACQCQNKGKHPMDRNKQCQQMGRSVKKWIVFVDNLQYL